MGVQLVGRIEDIIDVQAAALSDHLRAAITTASTQLRDELRAQVRTAGLGPGLRVPEAAVEIAADAEAAEENPTA